MTTEQLPDLSREELARYSRHLILEDVGIEGQKKLKAASVMCVGTGGLGSPLLMYLAAAGVGRIGICDFDVVDESNLQRQIIHGTRSVGQRKVHSAKERILDINPLIEVVLYEEALTSENALRVFEGYDIVVDGTDNFPTRYLVNDACVILGIPNVYGSIFKFEGQASVFNYGDGPHYRDLFPEPPPPGLVPSCAEGGVLGVLPGIIGSIQATETIKIILGRGDTLSGRLLLFDALKMNFRELKIRKDPATKPVTELIDYQQFCGVTDSNDSDDIFLSIEPIAAKERFEAGWKPYVLDVRAEHEAQIAQVQWVDKLQPHTTVSTIADELPKDRDILVYCKAGGRSAKACQQLRELGFDRLYNLEGGITGWAKQVDRSIPTY
jgi:adenylyltransferase/sulfurtransferase